MAVKGNIEYPFDYQELGPEETEELKNYYSPSFTKLIRLGSKGYFFYDVFASTILDIYNMKLRPTDVFVSTYPRSGLTSSIIQITETDQMCTTWTQELVWLLQNNCDFETAKTIPLPMRFPFLESAALPKMQFVEALSQGGNLDKALEENVLKDIKTLDTVASPRLMKCHLPLSLLPPSVLDIAKVVYVARDPLDVAVSHFLHMQSAQFIPKDKDFKTYWNFFIQDKVLWCPYFEHVKEAWNQRNHPNMTFMFYEELSKDLPTVARRLAKFLGKEYSEEQFQALCDHLKFDNFKNNASVNLKYLREAGLISGTFIRKGKSGGWRDHFDAEMTQQAESWIADNLRDTDLRFPQTQ